MTRNIMTGKTRRLIFIVAPIAIVVVGLAIWMTGGESQSGEQSAAAKPALTVTVISPQLVSLPVRISANGNIDAWQEASIGTEANGLRLIEVKVNVGDQVQRGQPLAVFAADIIEAELVQSHAAVTEAEVALNEANDNAVRARSLQKNGALPAQQIQQYLNAERAAKARLEAARAAEQTQRLRLTQTRILAPDDGVISARTATVGAVVSGGQELFRLIRGGRLEWRAEVAASDLARLAPGQIAKVIPAGGEPIEGRVRMIGPVVDTQTRNGLVYVDLPSAGGARAGMFARGEFEVGNIEALTLPPGAVLLRDGFSYVLRVGPDAKVIQTKVAIGRRTAERVEILDGIDASTRVVAAGGGFLSDGDLVRVVEPETGNTPTASSGDSL
jgi:RND family efflux transporter MFP subunit